LIKITSWAFQGDNVSVSVTYDLQASEYTFDVTQSMAIVLSYDEEQIKTWLTNNVANRRGQQLRDQVGTLLTPLVDVDIEAP